MKKASRMVFFVLIILVINPGIASGEEVVTFQGALELVFQNNPDLIIAELTLQNSKIDLEKSKLSSNGETRSQKLSLSLELEKNLNTYSQSRYNIINNLITNFVELTKKRKTVNADNLLLKIKEIELTRVNQLYQQGSASSLEAMNARSALEEQKLALHKSKEDLNKLIEDLKWVTGIIDQVQFKELVFPNSTKNFTLEQLLSDAIKSNFNIYEKDTRYQLAELELEKARLEGRPELDIQKLFNSKEIAHYQCLQARKDLEKKVADDLWLLQMSAKTIEIKITELEIAKENYIQTKTGFEQGFYTETQYLQSQVSLINAEKTLFTAQADYWLKVYSLYHQIGWDELIGGELK